MVAGVSNFATVYFVSMIETMKTSVYSPQYDKLRMWLKAHREAHSLSLREVSDMWGKHHSILGKIEQAGRKIEVVEFIRVNAGLKLAHYGSDVILKPQTSNRLNLKGPKSLITID